MSAAEIDDGTRKTRNDDALSRYTDEDILAVLAARGTSSKPPRLPQSDDAAATGPAVAVASAASHPVANHPRSLFRRRHPPWYESSSDGPVDAGEGALSSGLDRVRRAAAGGRDDHGATASRCSDHSRFSLGQVFCLGLVMVTLQEVFFIVLSTSHLSYSVDVTANTWNLVSSLGELEGRGNTFRGNHLSTLHGLGTKGRDRSWDGSALQQGRGGTFQSRPHLRTFSGLITKSRTWEESVSQASNLERYAYPEPNSPPWVTALPVDKDAYPSAPVDDILNLPVRSNNNAMGKQTKVAIVTMGIKSFTKFGGIGTCFYNYVHLYADRNFRVHIYYMANKKTKEVRNLMWDARLKYFNRRNIKISPLNYLNVTMPDLYGTAEMKSANKVYVALRAENEKHNFDTMIFHDYRGFAAPTIQAKRAGLEFQDTVLVVTCHTSSYNSDFFNGRHSSISSSVVNELEDYVRNFADVTVYLSHAFRDQLAKLSIYADVATPAKAVVLPNFVYGEMYEGLFVDQNKLPTDRRVYTKFAYFGRIDTLKGIHTFIKAVKIVADRPKKDGVAGLSEVAVIGDFSYRDPKPFKKLIADFFSWLKERGIKTSGHHSLMSADAAKLMQSNGYVSVMPSLYENYPMALLESLSFGIPCIHANAGGQSEVSAHNHNMFTAGDARDLARVMESTMRDGLLQDRTAADRRDVLDAYERLARVSPLTFSAASKIHEADGKEAEQVCSDVTIGVVTFADRVALIRDLLLHRLRWQTCSGFQVLVFINSPCDLTEKCGAILGDKSDGFLDDRELLKLRIILPPNGDTVSVSEARNVLVREAKTEFVALFDDDDVPRLDYVEVMRRAAIVGSADLVTSHCASVDNRPSVSDVKGDTVKVHHISLAAGNMGPGTNLFIHHSGKANVLMRTEVGKILGPCIPEHSIQSSPYVDWAMYTNFILNNARIVVVPKAMYYYKMNSGGSIFYSASDFEKYLGARKITNKYCDHYNLDMTGCEVLWLAKQLYLAKK